MNQTAPKNLQLFAGEHMVMLIHGMGANTLEVERLGQHLHGAGLSVFAPNIAGFCHGTPASNWENWLEQAVIHVQRLKQDYTSVSQVGVSIADDCGSRAMIAVLSDMVEHAFCHK